MAFSRAARRSTRWCSMIASTIWLPTVWTGLNEDIGSWKMSAISAPRMARTSSPFGASVARSTTGSAAAPPAGLRKRISPSTMRPGRSTILRIDRAVTLLPHPLSPTMPSVARGKRSKLTPSTALTVPSSWAKYVLRFRTDRSGSAWPFRAPALPALSWGEASDGGRSPPPRLASIRVGRIAQTVAEEVEGHDRHDHRNGRDQEPRRDGHGLDVLGLLEKDAPADRGRPQPQAQEAEGRLADDHGRQGQRRRRDDVAHERRHHVHEDGPHLCAAHQPRGDDEVLLAQGQKAPPHHAGELRPGEERDDDGDGEVDPQDRPVPGQRRGQAHPEGNRRDRAQDLDDSLDGRVGDAPVKSREPAEHHA